jgi:hypothetical protein
VNAFISKRQKDVMVVGEDDKREERRYSDGEINRELTTLKRILNLARQNGKLMHVPHVPMLKERNVRTGFVEREQIERGGDAPVATRRFSTPASSVWTRTRRRTTLFRLKAEGTRATVMGTIQAQSAPGRGPRLTVSL